MRWAAVFLRAQLAGRLDERERIARELHDTLLQSTQGLILMLQSVAGQLPQLNPMRNQLELALDQADRLLNEARDRVRDLRTSAVASDIARAVSRAANDLSTGNPPIFRLEVKGASRPLQHAAAEHIYSIAREALANAFAHADATVVEAEIVYDIAHLHVRIRDDGRGFKLAMLAGIRELPHFGLRGMRERAQQIGARFEIWSRNSAGTAIALAVPACSAYSSPQITRIRSPLSRQVSHWFRGAFIRRISTR